ncbi:MAG: ABC transporter ATP-binding protein/permease [[Eubacterium] saphenum]|nr:ABC transporter ATP-binding protein/permease [[Eubacterium] saphenum]
MLEIKNIVKDYATGSETVHALKDVSISFRESELVAVLGHSGCGKTTLLNIIGGLDSYTSGDLIINGKSTKKFKNRDWDTYRNHSVGFIFQSYNLIPRQSVLSNVELALTLSGVSKSERRKRAKEALEKVGLGDQIHKRPNQMSGGQMQRVAIARALVNDPDILLADEPTGALDSETSVQIMDLIKEIAEDRLVIMVTHNPDLAEQYATRIVKLVDGKIKSDSMPFDGNEPPKEKKPKSSKKTSMSFATALALSRNNLLTKKGRTFLTSFAGSIGIIGIALILSLSNGVQQYINSVEHSTLASYPISIQQETMDYTSLMESMMGRNESNRENRDPNLVYTNDISTEMVKSMLSEIQTNNLKDFKQYLESNPDNILDSITEIQYSYSPKLYIYGKDLNENIIRVNPSTVMEAMLGSEMSGTISQMGGTYSTLLGGSGNMNATNFWHELLNNQTTEEQYEVLAGRLPKSYNEVVFIVNEHNELSDVALYALGLRDQKELSDMMAKFMAGENIELDTGDLTFAYDQLMSMSFRLLTTSDLYKANDKGGYDDMSGDAEYMNSVLEKSPEIKVVGVIKPDSDSLLSSANSGGIGYTHALTEFMIQRTNDSELVKKQLENPKVDVFTGIEFTVDGVEKQPMSQEEAFARVMQMMSEGQQQKLAEMVTKSLSQEQLAQLAQLPPEQQQTALYGMATPATISRAMMSVLTTDQIKELMKLMEEPETTEATYDGNLEKLGLADLAEPSSISIYAKDFDGKEKITRFIKAYNDQKTAEDKPEDVINYTDYIGLMISSVSTIIDSISYILIAFVAISLVVSSIMIGIITYISVLERTKEIGILRAIGASKRDISNVFNAETLIVGFAAGAIGIGVTLLLNIPINIIIEHLTGISGVAQLPWQGGVILVVISMLLTFIAGLFPATIAAKKDPVEALRTE